MTDSFLNQLFIGVLNLLESLISQLLEFFSQVGHLVGVVLTGKFAVGGLDFILCCRRPDTQCVIWRSRRIFFFGGSVFSGGICCLPAIKGGPPSIAQLVQSGQIAVQYDQNSNIVEPTERVHSGNKVIGRQDIKECQNDPNPLH